MSTIETAASGVFVTFWIGRQHYALPLDTVSQVVRLPNLTDIAGAPPALAGMLNLRGVFLPVIDSHALIGVSATYALDSSILVITLDGDIALGLLVDEVDAVERISAAGALELLHSAPFVSGIMREGDRSVILLDPRGLRRAISAGER